MPYLYLVSAVVLMSILNILGAGFNRTQTGKGNVTPLYNLLLVGAAFCTWAVIYAFDFSFEVKVLPYSILFGVCYAGIAISLIKALGAGPTLLTSLLQQLSLIGVSVWGFAFWGTWDAEKAPLVLTGLALVVVSLVLSLYSGEKSDKKVTWKWIGYAAVMFVVTAGCSIVQKAQQIAFDGKHGAMLMFFGVLVAVLLCFVNFLIGEKPNVRQTVKIALPYSVGAGTSSALGNLFVILLATSRLSPNLIYPTLAVGCLAVTSIACVVLFKEKFAWWQWIGVFVGAVAVALLSIV
jgi:drug/metabolite transporter (DMT)-like permease